MVPTPPLSHFRRVGGRCTTLRVRCYEGAVDEPPTDREEERPLSLVTLVNSEGYLGEVRAGRHRLVVDEGSSVGGGDRGLNPYQLLLAALVQCTAATLRMYADRKGWELGEVRVRAQLFRTDNRSGRTERIDRSIHCAAPLDDLQRTRLAEIADRTPVTRTIRAGTAIDTVLT